MSDAEQKAAKFIMRPKPDFSAWRAAKEAGQPAAEPEAVENAEIGDRMPDGTIYAGISPDTNRPMYAFPFDASLSMTFNAAAQYPQVCIAGDKKDFRVPTIDELNVLFQNRDKGALKGTFNLTGEQYWSSAPLGDYEATSQRFSNGSQFDGDRERKLSVRCVRG